MSWIEILSTGVCIAISTLLICAHTATVATQHETSLFSTRYHNYWHMIFIYVVTYVHIVTSDFHDIGHEKIHVVQH